jgi:hypothetical protein
VHCKCNTSISTSLFILFSIFSLFFLSHVMRYHSPSSLFISLLCFQLLFIKKFWSHFAEVIKKSSQYNLYMIPRNLCGSFLYVSFFDFSRKKIKHSWYESRVMATWEEETDPFKHLPFFYLFYKMNYLACKQIGSSLRLII